MSDYTLLSKIFSLVNSGYSICFDSLEGCSKKSLIIRIVDENAKEPKDYILMDYVLTEDDFKHSEFSPDGLVFKSVILMKNFIDEAKKELEGENE